jgi:hypothetical protein
MHNVKRPAEARQVPVVRSDEIHTVPDHPVVVTGFRPDAECRTVEDLFDVVGNPAIRGCREGTVYEYLEKTSADVAAMLRAGALDFNATDSYVDDAADPADRLTIPPFIDHDNLLNGVGETRYYRKCLVVTQRGAYTAVHCDPGAMAGWMYLFEGRKTWHFWDAVYAPLFYDIARETFYDRDKRPHPDAAYQALLDGLPMWEGVIGPGDVMYFPPGWTHCVWTHADSFGFGGMSLHASQLPASVDIYLREKRMAYPDPFDYPAFLDALTRQGHECAPLCATLRDVQEIWKQNR